LIFTPVAYPTSSHLRCWTAVSAANSSGELRFDPEREVVKPLANGRSSSRVDRLPVAIRLG
jgi:hypothetical protein